MNDLNYHHLLYFWTIIRAGSVTAAARQLGLAQPTLSTQLRQLEEDLGTPLLIRAGRRLTLTEAGKTAFRHAEEIFTLGEALKDRLTGRGVEQARTLPVGVVEGFCPVLAQRLLQPLMQGNPSPRLDCRQDTLASLLESLAAREIDLFLSHAPVPSRSRLRAYAHLLGESDVAWFGAPALLRRRPEPFPRCLEGAPVLLPPEGQAFRAKLDAWFSHHALRPRVVGVCEDMALLRALAQEGSGFFPAPAVVAQALQRQHHVNRIGLAEGLRLPAYVISPQRRLGLGGAAVLLKQAVKVFRQA